MLALKRVETSAEDAVRSALTPILWVANATLFATAFFVNRIELPGAADAALAVLASALLLTPLAAWWQLRPPRHAHAAASLSIAVLQLCLVGILLAVPEPSAATLQVILAIGTAFFLIDFRWMLGMQLFGLGCWLYATGLQQSSVQWDLTRLVVIMGWWAAGAFYLGRIRSVSRIQKLKEHTRRREESERDVTRALEESEARLREAQQIARLGSYEWKLEENSLRWSDEHHRLFGWEPGTVDVRIERFLDAMNPEDRHRMGEAVGASLRDGVPVEQQYRIRRADGEERVLLGRGRTYRDESGRPTRHVGTTIDVTKQHHVESALRESEARLMAILTAMDASRAVIVSRDGIVESILGEPEETGEYGISGRDIPGKRVHDFLPGEAGGRVMRAVDGVYRTGAPAELSSGVELPTGLFHFDVSLRALCGTSGEIESVLAIVRDMTRQRADAEALRQAQKLESLGVLAGGVAHDFNNLLVGILGNAELALRRADPDSPLRHELEDIFRASSRAADLTRELLTYAGSARVSKEPTNFCELVADTVAVLRGSLAANVAVSFAPCPELAAVDVDGTQIRQVVMNFITNAAESMQPMGGTVEVRVETLEADCQALARCQIQNVAEAGAFCRVSVTDRGTGMDRETLDKIFDPFFTTKFQGRGLGLASAAGIVRSHGGALQVVSRKGRGTTFAMLLPRIDAVLQKQEEIELQKRSRRETILVVDDEDIVRTAACRMLEQCGYQVIEASTGSRAVDLIKAHGARVDLALIDLTMPEMDGEQTFEALRSFSPELPVVFMSGHSSEAIAGRVAKKTRAAHLTKPFRLPALDRAVSGLLDE